MGELRISLLGSFQASVDGRTLSRFRTSKVQALLIYLVVEAVSNPAALHPREALMDLLWSRLPLKSAQDNLRRTLYLLRKAIPGYETNGNQDTTEFIVSNRLSIGLNPDYRYYLDVADFCQQLHLNKLEEAAALYRGDFLANFYLTDSAEFETWATAWRAKLRRQALDALDHLTVRRLEQGHFSQAQRYARQQIAIDDLRERAYCQLMEALARSGQRASALEQYKICRRRLAEDLGIDLSQETKMLSQRIEADQIPHPDAKARLDAATMPGRITEHLPVARAADSDGEEATLPIFVERKRELGWLGEALTSANAGQGQLRFVIGGAGRGKTTLVSEFARRALDSDPDLIVATGYCRGQTGYTDPYAPFREILAQLSGDVNTALTTREQGRRLVSAMPWIIPLLVTQAPDLVGSLIPGSGLHQRAAALSSSESPWFQQLCAQRDAPYRHNLQQDRLFSQFGTTLKSIAAEKRLLLILEDLHLADPTSVALLYYLGQEIGVSPILLLGTYRPEEIAPIWGGKKHPLANISGELKRQHGDIWLDLSETTTAEGRSFVDALLDSAPNRLDASFRVSFHTHTGGHALFSVELLNALQERGDLVQDENGRWLAGEEIDWHTLPARVEGIIEQRLGRLDAELRSALIVASVEGETFTAEVVANVQKQGKRLMVRRLSREADNLHRLVKVEALASAGAQRLSRYRFRHHLFQQYLYDSLDDTERAYLHEDVGRVLEDLYRSDGEESAASLAWHFERAGMPEQALEYLIQAARQAIRLGANDQVIEHCTSGLNILKCATDSAQNVQRELTLETMLGIAFIASRGYGSPGAGAAFKRAQELYQQGEETTQLFPILLGLWGYHIHRADYQLARELAGQAFVLARQQQELGPLLVAHKMMGMTLFYIGEYALSLEHMEQVIHNYDPDLHGELGFLFGSDPVLSAFCTAALNLMYMGYPDQALVYNRKALQLARDLSYPFALAFTLLFVLWLHTVRNDPQAVLEIVEEQITLTGEQGFPLQLAIAEYDEYWARGLLGEAVESIPPMRRALADWEATGAQLGKTALLGGLAQVSKEASQIEDGLAFLAAAVGHGERTGERYYESDQYRIRGELKWAHGASNHDVEADFRRAINVARQLNARLPQLRATIALCRLWQQQERKEEARRALAEIYGWFSEGFDEPTLVEARQLLQTLA